MEKFNNKILIIEDEEALYSVLRTKFISEGYNVLIATDGLEGLALTENEKPDIILLDIVMPKMDGITMLKELRKNSWGKDIPVIVLSNLSEAEKTQELLYQGVSEYLIKTDWSLEEVVKKVKEVL
jgi:DNA-binding response OmpR family regulator